MRLRESPLTPRPPSPRCGRGKGENGVRRSAFGVPVRFPGVGADLRVRPVTDRVVPVGDRVSDREPRVGDRADTEVRPYNPVAVVQRLPPSPCRSGGKGGRGG